MRGRMHLLLVLAFLFGAMPASAIRSATLVPKSIQHHEALQYPVESRQYDAFPGLLWVTQRDGNLTVWDLRRSASPTLLGHVEYFRHANPGAIEGQDMTLDGSLVVAGLGSISLQAPKAVPRLYFFNVSWVNQSGMPVVLFRDSIAMQAPDEGTPLHVKWFASRAPAAPQRMIAIATMGWQLNWTAPRGSYLAAVGFDVAAGKVSTQPQYLQTGVGCLEGVLVVNDFAFVGGFCSTAFASIDLRRLANSNDESQLGPWSVLDEQSDLSYVQMVSAWPTGGNVNGGGRRAVEQSSTTTLFYSALWARPGGVAVFNGSSGMIDRVSMALSNQSSFANRVHVHEANHWLLTPLEHEASQNDRNGGLALFDLSAPLEPQLVAIVRFEGASATRVYCACFDTSGEFVYAFGADDSSILVFRIQANDQ